MAGGSNKRQRNNVTGVRSDDEELARLNALAAEHGLALGAYLRDSGLNAPSPRGQRRPHPDQVALRKIIGQLGSIGNNLNQIARAVNSGDPNDLAEHRAAQRAIIDMRNALFAALNMKPTDRPDDDH